LQELVEVDKSNKPLNNHRHNQPLMEAVGVVEVEEVEEAVEAVEVDQHLLQEAQPLSQLQHPKQERMAP